MLNVWFYVLFSIFIISLISLVGIIFISVKPKKLEKILIYMISFSAGALFGDVFIHIFPEIFKGSLNNIKISITILSGILFSFITEKFIHWQHCHMPITKEHKHPFAIMILYGDGIHNFVDGLIIAGSYLVNLQIGIATTLAVVLHEIPQEIGDFGILIHGGFKRKKALLVNFLISLTAFAGGIIALLLGARMSGIKDFLLPFAAGTFIYIAGSDLIPELHKETAVKRSLIQLITFILGIGIMFLLLLIG